MKYRREDDALVRKECIRMRRDGDETIVPVKYEMSAPVRYFTSITKGKVSG